MGGFKAALVCGTILAGGMGHVASAAEAVPDNGALVGEIVITGQKRTSTVQNTAATINVISAETLQASGVTGTASLQFATPGLLVSQDLGLQTQIFIRGIGSNLQGIGTGNSVATYIDGVFIPNSIASAQQFTDVERVEVLKGPQATLYGRNATGGALSIVTADPKFDLSGAADVSYGNYNAISTHVKVNIPLVADRLALSLATQTTKHDGYVRNLFRNTRLAYEDVQGVRGALKAVLNDDVDVVLRADYTDILESDVYKVTPSTSYYYLTPPSTLANPVPNYFAPDAREVYYNTDNRNPGRDSGISGALHWKTPIGSVTSVTSERYFNAGPIVADNDQTPLYSIIFGTSIDTTGARQSSDSFYHETYLTSDIPGPLKFVVGANYFKDKARQHDQSPLGTTDITGQTEASSAFVDGSYDINDAIRLIAGVRYSTETKAFQRQALLPVRLAMVTNKASYKDTSPRLGLEFRPRAGLLLYATATHGFKSGGFNQANALNAFNPEKIWSYEGGLKTRLWDGRLRLASSAFYYDYKDIQVLQYVLAQLPGQTVATLNQVVSNAATAKVWGWDNDADIALTDDLTVGGGLSLLHTEFGPALFCDPAKGSCAPAANATFTAIRENVEGNPLARAPKISANLYAEYKIPLSLPGQLKLRVDASYRSKTYFTVFKADVYAADAYWLSNASLRYDAPKTWFAEAYVHNLTDELAVTNIINSSPIYSAVSGARLAGTPARFERYAPPRTYGLRIGVTY
jgi:iron complex outermembrane receptor protein